MLIRNDKMKNIWVHYTVGGYTNKKLIGPGETLIIPDAAVIHAHDGRLGNSQPTVVTAVTHN